MNFYKEMAYIRPQCRPSEKAFTAMSVKMKAVDLKIAVLNEKLAALAARVAALEAPR